MTYQCDYKLQVIHLTFVFVILYITLTPSTLQRKEIKNVNAHTHFKNLTGLLCLHKTLISFFSAI